MPDTFLTTTSTGGLKALGSAAQRSYELISSSVRDRLGPRHAALFADSEATAHGDRLDWYGQGAGPARRLSELSEEEQTAARTVLTGLVADIRKLADEIGAMDGTENGRLSEALGNALEIPGEDAIYVLSGPEGPQPVLVSWGWVKDEHKAVRGILQERARVAPVTAVAGATAAGAGAAGAQSMGTAATATADRQSGPMSWGWLLWLGWLILALMIAAILYLLTAACGLRDLPWTNACPVPQAAASSELADTLVLRDQIARVEAAIAEADRACQPPPPPPLPPPPPAPPAAPEPEPEPRPQPAPEPQRTDLDRRLENQGGQQGALTVSLAWNSLADVDLEVRCPSGGRIWYNRKSACGGRLDVDGNHVNRRPRRDPIENIFFQNLTPGRYTVKVSLYHLRGQSPNQPFTVQIRHGATVKTLTGAVSPGKTTWQYVYEVPG